MRRLARIDLDAFAENLSVHRVTELDARADAFGHGISLVAPTALAAGVDSIIVSDESDAERAHFSGFSTVRIARIVTDSTAAASFGVDGTAHPVMTLVGEIIAVKRVEAGAGVSYGYTHRTTHATSLALIGLGYADGVPRLASNRADVLVAGAQHPLVGRIAMDQFVVSCGDASPRAGTDAVLFGDARRGEPTAVQWASWTERPALALTAGLGSRIRRVAR